jgi:hypothetical protein
LIAEYNLAVQYKELSVSLAASGGGNLTDGNGCVCPGSPYLVGLAYLEERKKEAPGTLSTREG